MDDKIWARFLRPEVVFPVLLAAGTVGMYYARFDDRITAVELTAKETSNTTHRIELSLTRMQALLGLKDDMGIASGGR